MFLLATPCSLYQDKGRIETRTLLSTKSQSSDGPQAGGPGEGHAALWAHKANRQPWSPNNGLFGETNEGDVGRWAFSVASVAKMPLSLKSEAPSLSC